MSRRSQVQQYISQVKETVVVVINASTPSGASPVGNGDGVPRFSDGTTPFSGTGIGEVYASGEEVAAEDIVTTALPVVASLPESYSVTVSERYVNEGGRRVTFSICGSNVADGTVVYWENVGTSSAADFSENVNSGAVTITKSLASVNFTIIADGLNEGNETLQLRVRTGSLSGTIVALSEVVTIADTPTYSITASAPSTIEGNGTITFTITTLNISDGTKLYWQNVGTTTSTDFTQRLNSGVVIINNNTGTVSFTPIIDTLNNEGTETIILRLRTLSTSGPIVATSSTVNVFNFMITPIYAIIPNVTSLNEEGSSVVFTVSTANVASGTTLYWSNIGTSSASDFTQGLNSGTITISSNTATITFTTVADYTSEGNETLQLRLRTGSQSGTIVATSTAVTITDTSTAQPTYAISPNVPSLDEAGSSVTFTVTTTNVSNGTTLYWENIGTSGASDFTQGLNSGTITINSNSGTIMFTTVADLTTEGSETLQIRLRILSSSGTIVATSSSVTITDSSTSVPTYSISPNVTSLDETQSNVTFTVTTTNVPNGTVLTWENVGTRLASGFTDGLNSGTVTINNNTATIVRGLTSDAISGNTTIILRLLSNNTVLVIASTVTVIDATPTYLITASAGSVNEGETVTYSVTTTNVPDATTLYWANTGTSSGADFVDGTNSGSVTITNNSGTISRAVLLDSVASESETIVLELKTGSTTGTTVSIAGMVTIIEKSQLYAVSQNITSVNEGSSVIFTVTTVNVPNTTLYWTVGGTISASDFSDDSASGSFSLVNGSATITRTLKADATTEGGESFALSIRTGSTGGTIVATSSNITVNDTSIASVAFTPATLDGLSVWLDGADYTTVTLVGGRVSQWSDKSGFARHVTQATATARPTLNGGGGLAFSSGLLQNSGAELNGMFSTGGTAFLVFNSLVSAGYKRITRIWDHSVNGSLLFDNSQIGVNYQNFGGYYVADPAPTNTTTLFTGAYNTTSTFRYSVNGTTSANIPNAYGGNTVYNILTVGNEIGETGVNGLTGTYYELIIYNKFLTEQDKQKVDGYLAWKWGIQSKLPANHPYKNEPPTAGQQAVATTTTLPGGGGIDVFITNYDSTGNLLWTSRIAAAGGANSYNVLMDESRSVYALSQFTNTTSAYNADGTIYGAFTVANAAHNGGLMVKYNSSGVVQWGAKIQCAGNVTPFAIASDSQGNIYVAGTYNANVSTFNSDGTESIRALPFSGSTSDVFLVKYNSSGFVQWSTRMSSIVGDTVFSIAVDANDNVYLPVRVPNNTSGGISVFDSDDYQSASITTSTTAQLTVIIKYSSVGYYQASSKLTSIVYDIKMDASKTNFYIAGAGNSTTLYNTDGTTFGTTSNLGNEDVFLAKYDTGCNPVWLTRLGGGVQDAPSAIAVDEQSNVYVYGRFLSGNFIAYNQPGTINGGLGTMPVYGSHDYFLVKYNSSGVAQWQTQIGGTGIDQPLSPGSDSRIACDGSGNVYVSGRYTSPILTIRNANGNVGFSLLNTGVSGTNYDGFYAKYNSTGSAQWASHIRSTSGSNETPTGVATTSTGYSVLLGTYANNGLDILSG